MERPPVVPANTARRDTIMVRSVVLPKYLDRPQIVRYAAANQLELNEMERQASLDALVVAMSDALALSLTSRTTAR